MRDHFWVRCGVFPYFLFRRFCCVFWHLFFGGIRRCRKWVIYIFDELSLLNATNQTLPVPMAIAGSARTGSNACQTFCLLQNKYNLFMWQLTGDVAYFCSIFFYHRHFLYKNNNMEIFFIQTTKIFIIIYLDFFSHLSWLFRTQCERNEAKRIAAINCDRNCYQLMAMKWNGTKRNGTSHVASDAVGLSTLAE